MSKFEKAVIIFGLVAVVFATGLMAIVARMAYVAYNVDWTEIERDVMEYAIADLESDFEQSGMPYEVTRQVKDLVVYQSTSDSPLTEEEYMDALNEIYANAGLYNHG